MEVLIEKLHTVRLKVTNRCSWNCKFCHNEGDKRPSTGGIQDVEVGSPLLEVLRGLRERLNVTEVHLTGGEPSSFPRLVDLVQALKKDAFTVKMTSVGTMGVDLLDNLILGGLDGLNLSIHAIHPKELSALQVNRTPEWALQQITRQMRLIAHMKQRYATLLEEGFLKINTIYSGNPVNDDRVLEVVKWAEAEGIRLRILNNVTTSESVFDTSIKRTLGLKEVARHYIAGSSSYTVFFKTPSGYTLGIKGIRNLFMPFCAQCVLRKHGTCFERFYGLRLEKREGKYYLRLCLHKSTPDVYMEVSDFMNGPYPKLISGAVEKDYDLLRKQWIGKYTH